jgi:hypothetical protein
VYTDAPLDKKRSTHTAYYILQGGVRTPGLRAGISQTRTQLSHRHLSLHDTPPCPVRIHTDIAQRILYLTGGEGCAYVLTLWAAAVVVVGTPEITTAALHSRVRHDPSPLPRE